MMVTGLMKMKTVMIMTVLFIQVLLRYRMMASTKIVMALIYSDGDDNDGDGFDETPIVMILTPLFIQVLQK